MVTLWTSPRSPRRVEYKASALGPCSSSGAANGAGGASLDLGTLRVEVCESTFYNVKVAALEKWLYADEECARRSDILMSPLTVANSASAIQGQNGIEP